MSGVEDQIWVQSKDLSAGVVVSFEGENPLSKNSRALINRGFVTKQKKYLEWLTVMLKSFVTKGMDLDHSTRTNTGNVGV